MMYMGWANNFDGHCKRLNHIINFVYLCVDIFHIFSHFQDIAPLLLPFWVATTFYSRRDFRRKASELLNICINRINVEGLMIFFLRRTKGEKEKKHKSVLLHLWH
jgi:hypothetical protein